MGDAMLPQDQRRTKTNVVTYKSEKNGLRSGLLGPVQVLLIAVQSMSKSAPRSEMKETRSRDRLRSPRARYRR